MLNARCCFQVPGIRQSRYRVSEFFQLFPDLIHIYSHFLNGIYTMVFRSHNVKVYTSIGKLL
jgi:hypothetical protein